MNALTTFCYSGSKITFANESGVRVNATQMAKAFNKRPNDWMRLDYTKEFLSALSTDTQIPVSALIQTVRGGNGEQGTWMHEDVALEFARWLSPTFAIWCNRRIKELLTAKQQSEKAEVLPPPIDNTLHNNELVEIINGKSVTTSRKLAKVLGRGHYSILDTIKNNISNPAFKRGNLSRRDYSESNHSHGYEFMLTPRALDGLAGVMRYGAKGKIDAAYKGAWPSKSRSAVPVLPMPEDTAVEEAQPEIIQAETSMAEPVLPLPADPAQAETASDESDGEITYTPEQQKYIDWLEGYNEVLGDRLSKTKAAKELYADLYENEKKRRLRNGEAMGYWHDLYEDLMLRLINGDESSLAEKIDAHRAFRKRISKG